MGKDTHAIFAGSATNGSAIFGNSSGVKAAMEQLRAAVEPVEI
jgi:hypothetical protein